MLNLTHSRASFSPQSMEDSRDWVQSFRSAGHVDDKTLSGQQLVFNLSLFSWSSLVGMYYLEWKK